jgi:serine/threonine protein kinase
VILIYVKLIKSTNKSTQLTIKQIQNILLQFITIIKLLKIKKIIHHDVKLANLLVKVNKNQQYQIKLCDFEMAIFDNEKI